MLMKRNYYNFHHTIFQEAPVCKKVVIWNFLDFGHVNFVHKRSYKYVKVLAKYGNATFAEFGVNHGLNRFFPFTLRHVMWHQFVPPDTVMHISRTPFGTYSKVIVKIREFKRDNKVFTRIEHSFYLHLPFFLLPFKKLVKWYMEHWSALLWEEDLAMCLRRQHALDKGFKDAPLETLPFVSEGLAD